MVAGGGTGGVTVFYGEQLNHTNAEVVYMDISITSMHIAQKRARVRNLQNIIWIKSWIEDIPSHGIGFFEEVLSSGVLHHLKNPLLGLKVLKDVLSTNGGMGLMLYAKYGRISFYQMQKIFKIINANQNDIDTEIQNANKTLFSIPKHNWLSVFGIRLNGVSKIDIYDVFLHERDVAFSISSLFKWIEQGGLYFIHLDNYKNRFLLNVQYIFRMII